MTISTNAGENTAPANSDSIDPLRGDPRYQALVAKAEARLAAQTEDNT